MSREYTKKQAIINLQQYLRQLSYFNAAIPQVPVDGIYGSETKEAIEIFQKNRGYEVTGEADRETWDALFQEYQASVDAYSKPIPIDLFYREPIPAIIRVDDEGFAVMAIQYMLNEAFLFYQDSDEISTDGKYNEQTAKAVRAFQGFSALPETGEVDLQTWNALTLFHNEHFRQSNQ